MLETFTPDNFVCGGGEPFAPRRVLKKTVIPFGVSVEILKL